MCKDKVVCLYNEILNKIVKQASAGEKDVKLVSYTKCSIMFGW